MEAVKASIGLSPAIEVALAEARRDGWSTMEESLDSVWSTLADSGCVVPTRRGAGAIGTLQACPPDQAHPKSLSANYGVGPFPLHTDGAHLTRPPEFTLLETVVETPVPTLLLDFRTTGWTAEEEAAFRHGVFAVGRGPSSFYAHAVGEDGRVRYDPACMFPVDPLARSARRWLEECVERAATHEWRVGTTLVIANRRCLHGRPDVARNPDRALRRLMIHWTDDESL